MRTGAKTILNCLDVSAGESVLILNDDNDERFIDALEVESEAITDTIVMKYPEPDNHGEEPPTRISEAMKAADVVIAPTNKSLSHTTARKEACAAGSRVVTLPGITEEIWQTSLQADYEDVKEICDKAYDALAGSDSIRIRTSSGTDIALDVKIDTFHKDTGLIRGAGGFGNLPAGEIDGGSVNARGVVVIDSFPFAPRGTEVVIEDNRIVSIDEPGDAVSELRKAVRNHPCVGRVAEFGLGTNPEAILIGNILQDEKVLGTAHIAFGDNTSYLRKEHEDYNPCTIHWDTICEDPTVLFDDTYILNEGEPVFLQ